MTLAKNLEYGDVVLYKGIEWTVEYIAYHWILQTVSLVLINASQTRLDIEVSAYRLFTVKEGD